jgi:hypothetical protein
MVDLFSKALLEKKVVFSIQKPQPRYWFNVPLGRSGMGLSNIANTFDHKLGVRVYLYNRYNADAALAQLFDQREQIETELGTKLIWNPNPENRDKIIGVYLDADISKRENWEEYCNWMVDMTKKFREVFVPRLRELDLSIERDAEPEN